MIETLKDTVELMNSDDYKDRFIAEYKQLAIRRQGLIDMLKKWDNGELEFTPTCARCIFDLQLRTMNEYMTVLEFRATLEGISL